MSAYLSGDGMTANEKQVHDLKTMRWKIDDHLRVSGMRTMHWNAISTFSRRWLRRGKRVWSAREPHHVCLVCSLHITTVCFSSAFFWTQVRQRKCLNSEEMNVPKQSVEGDAGNAWCVTGAPLWMKLFSSSSSFRFYCTETKAKRLLLLCSAETASTCSPWP